MAQAGGMVCHPRNRVGSQLNQVAYHVKYTNLIKLVNMLMKPSAMLGGHDVGPLRILLCHPSKELLGRLRAACEAAPRGMIESIESTQSLEGVRKEIGLVPFDAIYLDPLLSLDEASALIFRVRQTVPHIVFVLCFSFAQAEGREAEFYVGERKRFRHYFRLDADLEGEALQDHVLQTLYQVRADIWVESSTSRMVALRALSRSFEPPEIAESLVRFRDFWPRGTKTAFIIMPFGSTNAHPRIRSAIHTVLREHDVEGLWSADKELHDNLYYNVLTYLHGCSCGVAVFDRIEDESFNPNVSLEVGYLLALQKPVCLLKEKTLRVLHSDLVGHLYQTFDVQKPLPSVRRSLRKWMAERALL